MSHKITLMEIAVGFGIITSSASLLCTALVYKQAQDIRAAQIHQRDEISLMRTSIDRIANPMPFIGDMPAVTPCSTVMGEYIGSEPSWSPNQATGEPNTPCTGDFGTAWASFTEDGQDEWLELTYDKELTPEQFKIYETYNPGALTKITAVVGKQESVLWQGKDPAKLSGDVFVAEITPTTTVKAKTIRLYFASPTVPGWNEIDAVGIREKDDVYHWAQSAKASSTYADLYKEPKTQTF